MKRCPRCETTKDPRHFHRNSQAKDGLNTYCKVCSSELSAASYAANREQRKLRSEEARLRRLYGIDWSVYAALLESQGGVCAVCKEPCPTGHRLAVDHCHASGVVRGLLCVNCNKAIGHAADDPARLRAAADYLERCDVTA